MLGLGASGVWIYAVFFADDRQRQRLRPRYHWLRVVLLDQNGVTNHGTDTADTAANIRSLIHIRAKHPTSAQELGQ